MITPKGLASAKAAAFGVEVIELGEIRIEDEVIAAIPRHIAKKYRVVPVYKFENKVTVAVPDPSDLDTLDSLHHLLRLEIEPRVATEEEIEQALANYYGGDDSVGKMIQDITEGEIEIGNIAKGSAVDDGATVDADAPIIKLVSSGHPRGLQGSRASDIHLEPLERKFRVRYRDGRRPARGGEPPPKRLQASIISRLKIQANMSIAEKRIPQTAASRCNVMGRQDALICASRACPRTTAKAS